LRKYLVTIAVLLLASVIHGATLATMIAEFRQRTGEKDTLTSFYTNADATTWINHAQDKLVRIGGYIPMQVDIRYSKDSMAYKLPVTFKQLKGAIRRSSGVWSHLIYNPGFRVDSTVANYFVEWKNTDTALLYLGGKTWVTPDTIRIFYNGSVARMTALTDECKVSSDLQVLILEEAISMYEEAKRSYQAMALIRGQVRQDMGLVTGGSVSQSPSSGPGGSKGGTVVGESQ
jgi:hypothetical protein